MTPGGASCSITLCGLPPDDTLMREELSRFGVAHEWEVFDGDNVNQVHARIRTDFLPLFLSSSTNEGFASAQG